MARPRMGMRKIREILRQKWALGRTHREVAESLRVSVGTITETLTRATVAGLDWSKVEALDDGDLEGRLYGGRAPGSRPRPDCHWIHAELRKKGVTLSLLHLEYLEANPGGYQYTQFCEIYRRFRKKRRLSMRQVHRAGEKMFVDYAGMKPRYVDRTTGELVEVELFVAVLAASNYTFAEATRSQKGRDWIGSHQRTFRFFRGVTEAVVCDQLKSGVVVPCRYEPGIQRTYEELAEHYGTAIVPARPGAPKDKAKVESGVQVAERWILARLRNETFFSLEELNERIAELLGILNRKVMRDYRASRKELFERSDRPALQSLPERPFVFGTWKTAKVSIDYHVAVEHHYYSVPHPLIGEEMDVRVSATTVEIFLRGRRITSHRRSFERGKHTTKREHMPVSHRKHAQWSPSRFIRWGKKIGPATASLVEAILTERPHPEQGYRSCLGILRLEKRYGKERLEAACGRAFAVGARSYRHVDSILKNGLDRLPAFEREKSPTPVDHENIRGASYYQ
jgi:transposase